MILLFIYRYSLNLRVGSFLVYSVVIVIPHFLQHVLMKFVKTVLIKFMIVLVNGKYFVPRDLPVCLLNTDVIYCCYMAMILTENFFS